ITPRARSIAQCQSAQWRGALSRLVVLIVCTTAAITVAAGAAAAPGRGTPGQVLVRYHDGVSAQDQARLEHDNGAQRAATIEGIGTVVLDVAPGAEDRVIAAMERSGKVEYAERDGRARGALTPTDTYWSQ